MDHKRTRVVVGEGRAQRQGLLSFVLEGEGIHVVATARTPAELAQTLAEHRPDVVVLDDGIGSVAVSMTRLMVPEAKIIVVWPRGLVSIDGDASVEPSNVLEELGPTVDRVMGTEDPQPVGPVVRRAGGRQRGAPGTGGPDQARRYPNVTQLERRRMKLHPRDGVQRIPRPDPSRGALEPIIVDRETAPPLILPLDPIEVQPPEPTPTLRERRTSSKRAPEEPIVVIPDVRTLARERLRALVVSAAVGVLCMLVTTLAIRVLS